MIACKTLHTLRNCQLPKDSEISNFGNKDENSKQSWAAGTGRGGNGGRLVLCKIGPGGKGDCIVDAGVVVFSSPQADEILNFPAVTWRINNHAVEGARQPRGERKRGWDMRANDVDPGASHKIYVRYLCA